MPRSRRPLSETEEPVSTNLATNPTQIGHPTGISSSISTEEIREYFECPICLLVPRPGTPIFACSQGHMVCNVCRPQIRLCPICRIAITGKSLSEALIFTSTKPQYVKRLSIDLPVPYMKTTSSEHVVCINCLFVLTFKTIYVHNMF